MNKLIFGDGFHVTPTVMTQLQNDAREGFDDLVGGLRNCIIYGCVKSGTTISSGAILINGELFKFEGGTYYDNIKLVKTERTNIYKNNQTVNAGYTQYYTCASDGTIAFSSLIRYRIQYVRNATDWTEAVVPTGATADIDYPPFYRINEQGKLCIHGIVRGMDNIPSEDRGKLVCTIDVSDMNMPYEKIVITANNLVTGSVMLLTLYNDGTIYQDDLSEQVAYVNDIHFQTILEID